MDIVEFREFCLSLPLAEECMPFGPDVLVFKIGGRMFAYASVDDFRFFNVKCEPELAAQLREQWPEIVPGFHANKRHWNSVHVDGYLPESMLREQILHSYAVVRAGLPPSLRRKLDLPDE